MKRQSEKPLFSIVIPCFNEEEVIHELYSRLTGVLDNTSLGEFEFIMVDDGSKDKTYQLLSELHEKDPRFKVIKFSRNFGHHVAITAGLEHSKGDYVVMMDADLQDRPEEIPRLAEKLINENYDVVFGVRKNKQHSFIKRALSSLFIKFMNAMVKTDIPINSSIFRIMNRKVVDSLNSFKEQSRFITGLVSWMGFKQTGVEVTHGARFAGETKYPLSKQVTLAMNSMTAFSYIPLRIATGVGLVISVFSFFLCIYYFIGHFIWGFSVEGWTSIMVSIFFLGGIQLLGLGALGEYVGRIYTESQQRPTYLIDVHLDESKMEESHKVA